MHNEVGTCKEILPRIYMSIAIFLWFCLCVSGQYFVVFRVRVRVRVLWPVIGFNFEIDVVALKWVAEVRKEIAAFK